MNKTWRILTLSVTTLVASCSTTEDDAEIARSDQSLFAVNPATVYRIVIGASGKCIGIVNSSTANSAAVEARTCNGSAGQNFTLMTVSSGYYSIKNTQSLKCLDVAGKSTADGAAIIQYTCSNSATSQQWAIADISAGLVRLTSRNSGKVMEVSKGSSVNGTPVVQSNWTGAAYQQFQLSSGGACSKATWGVSMWDSATSCWAP